MKNTQNTALLVMDMQNAILAMLPENANKDLTGNVAKAIAAARSKSIPVIYVVVGFRQGMPEVGETNKGFSGRKAQMAAMDMSQFTVIHPALAPQEHEVVVTKRRVSSFTGSDLEVILRAHGIQHLALCGIATSGVVLSTLRQAADMDYQITVLEDACADRDEEVHRVLMTKVFPNQADVVSVDEWVGSL